MQPTQLVFCANPGRSGSKFLQELLLSAESVVGGHEELPQMTGEHLFAVERFPAQLSRAARSIKADAIAATLEDEKNARVYADTSNMFIKTFADVVTDRFGSERIKVIRLRRRITDVARSFRLLGCWTDRNTLGSRGWMFDPTSPMALAARYVALDTHDPTAMIVGYLVECELRAEAFVERQPSIHTIEVTLPALQSLDAATSLLAELGLEPSAKTVGLLGERVHSMRARKADLNVAIEPDFDRKVESLLDRFLAAGAPVQGLLDVPAA